MTQNRRIAINFLATYGRSLFALACGLFSGRWLLMSLGEVDYGLFGVVGGLTAFINFFNGLMATAVSRYYAFNVGRASISSEEGLENCRKWFTTAVSIHILLPVFLMAVGYPVGLWAVKNFLTIPPDRIEACLWVWRCVCMSCFVSMISVPYIAMYTAKQEIAEMTIYSVAQTALNVVALYYMVTHDGQWLVVYAAWFCLLSVTPQLIMSIRSVLIFPECKFRWRYVGNFARVKELATFAALRFAGACTMIMQGQGVAILTNKYLGPARNAAMTVGNTLSSQSETLAAALDTALNPAIINACGAGEYDRMRKLSFAACKHGTLLMLIFALPLSLEVNEVARLWLKEPPTYAASLCVCLLVCLVLEKVCAGHWMVIFAFGRIGWYQFAMSMCGLASLVIAWALMYTKLDLLSVGFGLIIGKLLACLVRLFFGRLIGGMSILQWIRKILLPLTAVSLAALLAGGFVILNLEQSFQRIVATTLVVEFVFLPLCYFAVLDQDERNQVSSRIRARLRR